MPTAFAKRCATARPRPIITIDGPAGVGKSTAAKLLARHLGLMYLDTGATYRTLAYAALSQGIDLTDIPALLRLAHRLPIALKPVSLSHVQVLLAGRDITRRIRREAVTDAAAVIAQYPAVRAAMVRLQRRLARGRGIVAEGRDTGSVVFPRARHKFFLTASSYVRARRRQAELRSLQEYAPPVDQIVRKLRQRDRLDRTRRIGPLVEPRGAVRLDTSALSVDTVVRRLRAHLADLLLENSSCVSVGNSVP